MRARTVGVVVALSHESPFMSVVRPYQARDRESVFRIAADTAFFGEPVEAYLDDRALFCDALYRYYTDLEPWHGWVACANERVTGFLMGCADTAAQRHVWSAKILPRLTSGVLTGKYQIGSRTLRHAANVARFAFHSRPHVDLRKWPAHLHLNVAAARRGQGIGRRLLDAFLTQLREERVRGVHLHTTTLNFAAVALYESAGFRPVARQPAPQWRGLRPGAVFNVCYALDLQTG